MTASQTWINEHESSLTAWLRPRYAPATVSSTVTDCGTIIRLAHEGEPLPERLRPAAKRLLAWASASALDLPAPIRTATTNAIKPRPRKTRAARAKTILELTGSARDALTNAHRTVIASVCRAHPTPTRLAIAVLADEGTQIATLLRARVHETAPLAEIERIVMTANVPFPKPATTFAVWIAPRGSRSFGGGGAYQRLRREWPHVLLAARTRDNSIPADLMLGDLEK